MGERSATAVAGAATDTLSSGPASYKGGRSNKSSNAAKQGTTAPHQAASGEPSWGTHERLEPGTATAASEPTEETQPLAVGRSVSSERGGRAVWRISSRSNHSVEDRKQQRRVSESHQMQTPDQLLKGRTFESGELPSKYSRESSADSRPRLLGSQLCDQRLPEQSEAERKLANFRLNRDASKHVCVCGASAYYERESVSLGKERLRLKQESERLQNEIANLRESRERISMRLLDVEEMESQLRSRDSVIAEKEAIVDEEMRRAADQLKRAKQRHVELDAKEEHLIQQEKSLEILKRKLEKERLDIQRLADEAAEDGRRATELSARLSRTEARLAEEKAQLAESLASCEELQRRLAVEAADQARRRAELDEKIATAENDEARLQRWENEIRLKEKFVEEHKNDAESIRLLNDEIKATLDHREADLEMRERDVDQQQSKIERLRQELKRDQEAWEAHRNEEERRLRAEQETYGDNDKALDVYGPCSVKRALEEETENVAMERQLLEDREETLRAFERELDERSARLQETEETMRKARTATDESTRQLEARWKEVTERESNVEAARRQLQQQKQALEAQKMKQEAAQAEVVRMRTAIEAEGTRFAEKETELMELEKTLTDREQRVSQRETALNSQEARSEWHQSVLKDVLDAKDRLELQAEDFELEKRAFEEMRAALTASHERAMTALKMREQALAALEVKVEARCRDVQRQEALLTQRLAQEGGNLKQKLLTVSGNTGPLRSTITLPAPSLLSSPAGSFPRRYWRAPSMGFSDQLPEFPASSRSVMGHYPRLDGGILSAEKVGSILSDCH